MQDLDKILDRVRKLLAVANDDRANPNEAANAAAMAARMMAKYQLEESDVVFEELKNAENLGTEDVVATAKTNGTPVRAVPTWAQQLAVRVSRLYDCGASIHRLPDGQACVRFYGYRADVQPCRWTYEYLIAVTNKAVKEFHKTETYALGGRKASNDFRSGFNSAILGNLREAQIQRERQPVESTSTALVVAKEEAITEHFGNVFGVKKSKSRSRASGAYFTGVVEGKRVDVTRSALNRSGQSTTQQVS